MFSEKATIKSTGSCWDRLDRLKTEWNRAEAVVIGAGAGLSASAGLTYSGERFETNFADFIAKYHYSDMYTAGFYPYGSPEEYWAYWSRHILLNRYDTPVGTPYLDLHRLVRDRDYFVLTTNVDHCFQRAGFDKSRLFYTQGDYGLWQCTNGCGSGTFDNEEAVRQMVREQRDLRIPSRLVPHCPACGKPMMMNLRCDGRFVEDEGWHRAAARCQRFLREHRGRRVLYLELGVGGNTPGIIKIPFQQMTRQNENAVYACVNLGEAWAPEDLAARAVCLNRDIGAVLREFLAMQEETRSEEVSTGAQSRKNPPEKRWPQNA